MKICQKGFALLLFFVAAMSNAQAQSARTVADFDKGWKFHLGDVKDADKASAPDKDWRVLNLPHDWSIEGTFSKDNPASPEGGALPGGTGWYRKTFTVPMASKGKQVYIDFDGVYHHSDVWVNGHHLGFRPNGYISFRYELTKYLNYGGVNVIAVKVDNSQQPNSRWYSGSGIYRNVWLVTTNPVAIDHWGTCVTTPKVSAKSALVSIDIKVKGEPDPRYYKLVTTIYDAQGKAVKTASADVKFTKDSTVSVNQKLLIANPKLWSVTTPYLYKAVSKLYRISMVANEPLAYIDSYTTPLGIRTFIFDADKGFILNGKPMKILGVCDHHDLGSLGSAINTRALERQLQILKGMGVNGIRTSHNPPAPELLDLVR
jgi:beta-galactosidase